MREELRDQYLEPYGAFADYVMDLDARYNEETGVLTVLLPVTHQTTPEAAVAYAQDVLATIGTCVHTQNFYYTEPETNEEGYTTDYGSFLMSMMCWFRYSLMIKRERYPSILSMTP